MPFLLCDETSIAVDAVDGEVASRAIELSRLALPPQMVTELLECPRDNFVALKRTTFDYKVLACPTVDPPLAIRNHLRAGLTGEVNNIKLVP